MINTFSKPEEANKMTILYGRKNNKEPDSENSEATFISRF